VSDITAAVILRIDPDRIASDLDRVLALALPSFERFVSADAFAEIVFVVPPEDVAAVARAVRRRVSGPHRVIDEQTLVPHLAGSDAGWRKQQIIKLALPAAIATPWILVLDADVVATREIDEELLLPGGRAIWQREPVAAHPGWWEASAAVLGLDWRFPGDAQVFGVTPALLHRDALVGLQQRVQESQPAQHWTRSLLAVHGWTEYSLYWSHVVDRSLHDALYADSPRHLYDLQASVWVAEDLAAPGFGDELRRAFDPHALHCFYVFQSNLEQPLDDTVRLLRPWIGPGRRIRAGERIRWMRHRVRRHLRYRIAALRRRPGATT